MRQKLQRLCTSNHLLRLHGKGQNWALLRYLLINIAKIGGPTDTHCQADKVLQDTASRFLFMRHGQFEEKRKVTVLIDPHLYHS